MFAVIKTGGKQYRVAADDLVEVDRIEGEAGAHVTFAEVLAIGGDDPVVGTPTVAGASVAGEVVEQGRGSKVIAFKKRRRKNSRRKRGHRQQFTVVRITEILTGATNDRKATMPETEPQANAATPETTAAADSSSGVGAETSSGAPVSPAAETTEDKPE